mmetsp:Transcript_15081/g.38758  ORF Transcript_15081/g.38758 Transcript_15081/m.38758 type:complete len:87 (+) Transcript_15081:960-1220(+)
MPLHSQHVFLYPFFRSNARCQLERPNLTAVDVFIAWQAVCGYLGLTSSSETADGERITTVTNPRAKFSPPLRRLSTVDQMNEGSDL